NGLRVIVVPTGYPNLVSLQIPVQTGSRNEVEEGKSGFAHFFEHMMFRGTERHPAHEYQRVMTLAGARQNAYTTDDYTNYHVTFAKEDLETVLALEADRFMHLAYSEEDFKTESRAILGEYNKGAADPVNQLEEAQREAAYQRHTYRHTTMGFLRDIEAMPEQMEYSKEFFSRWYRPEYTAIVVAGDVDPAETVRLVEKHWGAWERGTYTVEIPEEPEPTGPVTAHVDWPTTTLPWVTVAFHGPRFDAETTDFAALDMLLDLWFGPTSALYRRLVEVEQKVDQFIGHIPPSQDPMLATIYARVKDPADALAVRDAILAEVARARTEPVTAARLEEAKSHARYGMVRRLDDTEAVASLLARFVRFRREYETLNALYERYDELTVEHLLEAGERWLRDERLVQTTLAHGELEDGIRRVPPLASFAAPEATADFATIDLRSLSPLVRVKVQFAVGSSHDPAGKEGLAALAAEMIAEAGSADLRFDEIRQALFPIAGSFEAQVDRDVTTFTGVMHRETIARWMEVALPQLLRPGFREDDFRRLKESQHNGLVEDLRSNNDEELGKEALQTMVFAGTPYGHPTLGTVAGIEAIALDDVRSFVAEQYVTARMTLGVAGDVPEEALERLTSVLAALPAGTAAEASSIEGKRSDGLRVRIIEKDTRATAISFGHPIGVTRSHPDFAALWLARAWLGEHRASHGRLFQRIREVRGINYGDYAYIEAFPGGMYTMFPPVNVPRRAQLFEIWIRPVVPENAVFTLKLALWELRNLIENGMNADDFEATRTYLEKNVFVLTKTQDQQLGYALDSRWHGTGEFVETMREKLAALTVQSVNDAVRRHLTGEDLAIVMITKDAQGLSDALLSSAPATIAYDAAKPADLLAEDAEVGSLALGLTAERIEIVPVAEVFAR
ncbi:MAG TPA: pitrilysin family protein, partial [Tepidiformaceae bacterium]|nr:pitrilysin family protein [Tepidiformaceae bacterium]